MRRLVDAVLFDLDGVLTSTAAIHADAWKRMFDDYLSRLPGAGEQARAGRWWWESGAPKECGIHCAIETGGFEHELHAIVGGESHE